MIPLRITFFTLSLTAALLFAAPLCSAQEVRADCPEKTAWDYYIPKGGLFAEDPAEEHFLKIIPHVFLETMGEHSLSCGKQETAFRFLIHRSFHSSVAVRISQSKNKIILDAVEQEPGEISAIGRQRRKRAEITQGQLDTLISLMNKADIWSRTLTRKEVNETRTHLDGSVWLFESVKDDRYKAVTFRTPSEKNVKNLGIEFLKLTGWDYPEDQIY
ncbi:MAG: hypothetical protein DWQ47_13075 [Acidobacteria bacterium]|nr:MAG: hypothetical protein DWQ32_00475 [Acidobacteriota bacterium]REK02986.1 MAG: hypothetical protein DWQ38_11660 [Acidobacteriota bacterium]REK13210.1 MAG: hypothetical protein DWQ43_06165 [Acidobacteriota bacterium]REK41204.1 MAG: hypothetical protein DWQ47_13075 [Acidobacteriota bacterium]